MNAELQRFAIEVEVVVAQKEVVVAVRRGDGGELVGQSQEA